MDRYDRAVKFLREQGVRWSDANPPAYRLLRRAGIGLRPPLFQKFWPLFVFYAGLFGLGFVPAMVLIQRNVDVLIVVISAVIGSLMFGAIMSWLVQRKARRLALPDWEAI